MNISYNSACPDILKFHNFKKDLLSVMVSSFFLCFISGFCFFNTLTIRLLQDCFYFPYPLGRYYIGRVIICSCFFFVFLFKYYLSSYIRVNTCKVIVPPAFLYRTEFSHALFSKYPELNWFNHQHRSHRKNSVPQVCKLCCKMPIYAAKGPSMRDMRCIYYRSLMFIILYVQSSRVPISECISHDLVSISTAVIKNDKFESAPEWTRWKKSKYEIDYFQPSLVIIANVNVINYNRE